MNGSVLQNLIASAGVPAVCAMVAVAQINCATTQSLVPWKGGGFGMFATIDAPSNRYLSVVGVDDAGQSFDVLLPSTYPGTPEALTSRGISRLLAMPDGKRLQAVADAVLAASASKTEAPARSAPRALRNSRWLQILSPLQNNRATVDLGRKSSDTFQFTEVEVSIHTIVLDSRRQAASLQQIGQNVVSRH